VKVARAARSEKASDEAHLSDGCGAFLDRCHWLRHSAAAGWAKSWIEAQEWAVQRSKIESMKFGCDLLDASYPYPVATAEADCSETQRSRSFWNLCFGHRALPCDV
jgi:hypothetical protein